MFVASVITRLGLFQQAGYKGEDALVGPPGRRPVGATHGGLGLDPALGRRIRGAARRENGRGRRIKGAAERGSRWERQDQGWC
jgi:hypothetical protein